MRASRHLFVRRAILIVIAFAVLTAAFLATLRMSTDDSAERTLSGPYVESTIRPSIAQTVLDADVHRFYQDWKSLFVRQDCGEGMNQVYSPDAKYPYVAEAQAYGLVIAASMAGTDPSARELFDGILAYVLAHPSGNNENLMAAEQDIDCADTGGSNSATDGDMDIAYSLLLADKQWGSAGTYDYRTLALRRIAALKQDAVNPRTKLMLLGDWSERGVPRLYNVSRTSDWNIHHFRVFAAATGDPEWDAIGVAHQNAIATLQETYSARTGLLPDFVEATSDGVAPVDGKVLESEYDGAYYFNACRVPWRLGLDAITSGDRASLHATRKISTWARTETRGDPDVFGTGYTLDGSRLSAADSSAFFTPLAVAAMTDPAASDWLDSLWTKMADTPAQRRDYYGATIQLQVMLIVSGRYTAA